MERTFQDFENDFRKDFDTRFKSKGFGFERYRPAYQYGFEAHNHFAGRDWKAIEPELRADWQKTYPSDMWDDFKDAVRTGFERFTEGARSVGQDMQRGFDRTTGEMSRTFDMYDRDFQSDYDRSFRMSGHDYTRFRPAYQYGYNLANEKRFRGRQWNEIEMDARRDWEMQHPGDTWQDFKDAVRHAYQRVAADVKDAFD